MNPRFLFVGGTARSGTSILTQILTEDPSICLGLERYNKLLSSRSFTPALFESARFFAVTPGDTWYDSLSKFESHCRKARQNFSSARYVGGKIPQLPRRLDYVLSNFPEARIIITLRDIASVARSYAAQRAWRERLAPRRPRFLDAQADDFIRQHARFDLYRKVRAHARGGSAFGRAQKLGGRIKRLVA